MVRFSLIKLSRLSFIKDAEMSEIMQSISQMKGLTSLVIDLFR